MPQSESNKWFSVLLLVRIHVEGEAETDDGYQIRIVLVQSETAEGASDKALALAKQQDWRYTNAAGATVTWTCVEALDSSAVAGGLEDGREVYSFAVDEASLQGLRTGFIKQFLQDAIAESERLREGGGGLG
jgi:hypothetical protein